MARYDEELLAAASRLLVRRIGQRGKLPGARVRRSISTSYYALFHFMLDEVGSRIAGTGNDLRTRRRLLARTISHTGMKNALDKVRGVAADASVADFLRTGNGASPVAPPRFARNLANAFIDAQKKRHDADYDLDEAFSETDARLLRLRVNGVVARWRSANTPSDRDFKHALSMLILLKGKLRAEP